jgi:hypothetical protein
MVILAFVALGDRKETALLSEQSRRRMPKLKMNHSVV